MIEDSLASANRASIRWDFIIIKLLNKLFDLGFVLGCLAGTVWSCCYLMSYHRGKSWSFTVDMRHAS
jgi:hypothetical protein